MKKNLFLMILSLCFIIILISNRADAMYLTNSPATLSGEVDDPFSIDVYMYHEAGDTGLMKDFTLRLEWSNTIIDTVSFTNLSTYGTFTDAVVNNSGTYDVKWDYGSPGISTPDTPLGTFNFLGNTPGTEDL